MREFLNKLKSRKFIACIAGVILGASFAFGADKEVIYAVCGAVTSLVSLVAYIVTEGKVDAANASKTAETVANAVNMILNEKEEN